MSDVASRQFVIDGARITGIAALYDELNRVFMADEDWRLGESLDALNDMLFGGYGALAGIDAATIVWRDAEASRAALGVAATEHLLRARLPERSHFNNAPITAQLDALSAGHGTTYFDIVLQVFGEHPNINLVLG